MEMGVHGNTTTDSFVPIQSTATSTADLGITCLSYQSKMYICATEYTESRGNGQVSAQIR